MKGGLGVKAPPNGMTGATLMPGTDTFSNKNQERREALSMEEADVLQRDKKLEATGSLLTFFK